MASKHCLQALLTSIAIEHVHVRTDVLTENNSPLGSYVTLGDAHRGGSD
jgi:hypothetical protein